MVAVIVLGGLGLFALAYLTYGRYLTCLFGLDAKNETPAHLLEDGVDYCPASAPVLFGHHFASIAGAGPIVGPVFASLLFGWLPAVIWIILGSIFVGGVHDLGSLAVSVKNKAQSVAHVARDLLSPRAGRLFLAFIWLALVYVLVVFLDLTAATFAPSPPAEMTAVQAAALRARGGGVATSSLLFVLLALALGWTLRRRPSALGRASLLFVPLMFLSVYLGQLAPIAPGRLPEVAGSAAGTWRVVLVGYCYLASVAPVSVLLQPRDYLSSFLLYACLGGGLIGIAASLVIGQGAPVITYPAFLGFHASSLGAMGALFPALFVTVACGACSGFHSVVASGTTAKQLDRENHARAVGYGSMLLEGLLALVAVATVAVLSMGSPEAKLPPPVLFASGLARFLGTIGVPHGIGQSFAMLALSTFLLTTLDTCTRLARYTLSELLSLRSTRSQRLSTVLTLAIPLVLTLIPFHDAQGQLVPAWKVIWPVFGATNQLLGGFALLVLTLWLRQQGRPIWATLLPTVLMIGATLTALVQLAATYGVSLIGTIAALLLALALVLLWETARTFRGTDADHRAPPPRRPIRALDS